MNKVEVQHVEANYVTHMVKFICSCLQFYHFYSQVIKCNDIHKKLEIYLYQLYKKQFESKSDHCHNFIFFTAKVHMRNCYVTTVNIFGIQPKPDTPIFRIYSHVSFDFDV